jgi:hypothetical protein
MLPPEQADADVMGVGVPGGVPQALPGNTEHELLLVGAQPGRGVLVKNEVCRNAAGLKHAREVGERRHEPCVSQARRVDVDQQGPQASDARAHGASRGGELGSELGPRSNRVSGRCRSDTSAWTAGLAKAARSSCPSGNV